MAEVLSQDVDLIHRDMFYQSFFRLYEIVVTLYSHSFVKKCYRQ